MAADKKTRGPRKRPPVLWAVPTREGLSDLLPKVRRLAEQSANFDDRRVLEKACDVIELQLIQMQPTRHEIDRVRWHYVVNALYYEGRTTIEEACEDAAERVKGTAFQAGADTIRKSYYRVENDGENPWRECDPRKVTSER